MSYAAIWMVLGLGLGFGIAFALRRYLPAWRKRRQAATPKIYASRQEKRKDMREREKKEQSGRKNS